MQRFPHLTLSSGYGLWARHFLPRLARKYELRLFTPVFAMQGMLKEWQGIKVLSGQKPDYGEDLMLEHYRREQCTLLLTVGDWFHFRQLPQWCQEDVSFSWVPYAPFDFLSAPPEVIDLMRYAMHIVPFSEDSARRFQATKLQNLLPAVPLGIETSIWHPYSPTERAGMAKAAGFQENALNLLIVAANQGRKYVRQQLEAISIFRQAHPELPVRLYYHTAIEGERNAVDDVHDAGLADITKMADPYLLTQGGFPEEDMAKLFSAASLVLATCFLAGQPVVTAEGIESIEAIEPGRFVLSHTGAYRKVLQQHRRPYVGEVITLKAAGLPAMTMTGGHPLLVLRPSDGDQATAAEALEFVQDERRAKTQARVLAGLTGVTEQTIGNWVSGRSDPADPRFHRHWGRRLPKEPTWRAVKTIVPGDFVAVPRTYDVEDTKELPVQPLGNRRRIAIPLKIAVTDEFLWIAGMYIAEGAASLLKSQLRFSLGEADVTRGHTERLMEYFKGLGFTPRLTTMDRHRVSIVVYSKSLCGFFRDNFGHLAHYKRLPQWTMALPKERYQSLLDGLIAGDGHMHTRSGNTGGLFSTTSRALAYQVWLLFARLGVSSSLSYQAERAAYTVTFSEGQTGARVWFTEEFLYLQVRSAQTEDYQGEVFNLAVEEDASYCVPFAAHNCQEGWGYAATQALACGRPVIGMTESAVAEQVETANGPLLDEGEQPFGRLVPASFIDYTQRLPKAVADPRAIAQAIEEVVAQGMFFSQAAADRIAAAYNWDAVAARWCAVFDQVHEERERLSLYIPKPSPLLQERSRALRVIKAGLV